MQFLSENRLNGYQIFGRFGILKQNPNRISVFRTSLVAAFRQHRIIQLGQVRHWSPQSIISPDTPVAA